MSGTLTVAIVELLRFGRGGRGGGGRFCTGVGEGAALIVISALLSAFSATAGLPFKPLEI